MEGVTYGPDALMLYIYSVADFDVVDRVALICSVMDEFPELRPLKCGPRDPPRTKVTTMQSVLGLAERPLWYLLVRATEPYEGGELDLRRGRGGYLATSAAKAAPRFSLVPHRFHFSYDRHWFDNPQRYLMVADFFGRMCDAMDAFYGFSCSQALWLARRACMPAGRRGLFAQLDRELPDVSWLNYFGPAWLNRTDRLLGLGYEERRTSNGGIVLQTTETPFVLERDAHPVLGYPWKRPLMDALGKDTFKWSEQVQAAPGVLVPSWEEHFAVSPGTNEMPWANWKGDEADRKRAVREKTFPKKARATEQLVHDRVTMSETRGREEFSTDFDATDFRRFFRELAKRVEGDLGGRVGSALLAEIAAAPIDTQRSYRLQVATDGENELIEFAYFIDDIDQVDVYLFGSAPFRRECLAAFESL